MATNPTADVMRANFCNYGSAADAALHEYIEHLADWTNLNVMCAGEGRFGSPAMRMTCSPEKPPFRG